MPSKSGQYLGAIDWYPNKVKPERLKARKLVSKDFQNKNCRKDLRTFVDVTELFDAEFMMTAYTWERKCDPTINGVLEKPNKWLITNNYFLSCEYQQLRDEQWGKHVRRKKIEYRITQNPEMGAHCIFESVPFEIVQKHWNEILPLDTDFAYTTRGGKLWHRQLSKAINIPMEPDTFHDGRIGFLIDFNSCTTKCSKSATGKTTQELREWMMKHIPSFKPFTDDDTIFLKATNEFCYIADFLK